ncbi:MAG: serine protease [candidate division Zixibacteria bacterium]|nr:serine protease [candidate division Zixibacteria bacterium]
MRITDQAKKTARFAAVFFSVYILLISVVVSQSLEALDSEISTIISNVSQSVVTVEARLGEGSAPFYRGQNSNYYNPVKSVLGSGIIVDSSGHILTIQSLVDGFDYYHVDIDGRKVSAELVGIDRRLNLAVLKITDKHNHPVELSPYPPLMGRMALSYGRSIGLTGYPTLGVIAGQQADGTFLMSGTVLPGLLGGGVFDLSGRLIGIISAGSVSGPETNSPVWGGIIMVPAGEAFLAAQKIISSGSRDAGYLGVRTTSIELVTDDGTILGEAVVVADLAMESPAAFAGLSIGDIITSFSRKKITSNRQLQQMILNAGPDSIVTIDFLRGQNNYSVRIALSIMPGQSNFTANVSGSSDSKQDILAAFEIQQRIDSMKNEMRRMQLELDRLINRFRQPR